MSSSSRLVLVGLVAHHQTSVSTTLNVSFECLLYSTMTAVEKKAHV